MGLRTVVVVALAAWLGWLLARGILRRAVPWIGIAVIAVPLVALFWTERQWVGAEQRFTAIARSIAPGSAGVHCQRLGETFTYAGADLGRVSYAEDGSADGPAMVTYETCQHLSDYWRSSAAEKDAPPLEQVIAVHVLTHEARHLAGDRSESETECRAMQSDADVAQRLGATPSQARALAVTYLISVHPRMPVAYRTTDCRPDGPLDRTPRDRLWP
ncbi:MAG: hypothetical protein M0Z98_08055 [Actinomycetales bacterium]|nr:hypothetical protein [Actinomycetales bacterium]